jgi:hypothetical protein
MSTKSQVWTRRVRLRPEPSADAAFVEEAIRRCTTRVTGEESV